MDNIIFSLCLGGKFRAFFHCVAWKLLSLQIHHINGLPKDWESKKDKVHQLFSRVPHYNSVSMKVEYFFLNKRGKMFGLFFATFLSFHCFWYLFRFQSSMS